MYDKALRFVAVHLVLDWIMRRRRRRQRQQQKNMKTVVAAPHRTEVVVGTHSCLLSHFLLRSDIPFVAATVVAIGAVVVVVGGATCSLLRAKLCCSR